MTAFQYTALDKNGKRIKGVAEGDSARLVRQQLREKQLTPLDVEPVAAQSKKTEGNGFSLLNTMRRKMSPGDLSLITRQMATLLDAGIPVDEVLTAVSEQTEKQFIKSGLDPNFENTNTRTTTEVTK